MGNGPPAPKSNIAGGGGETRSGARKGLADLPLWGGRVSAAVTTRRGTPTLIRIATRLISHGGVNRAALGIFSTRRDAARSANVRFAARHQVDGPERRGEAGTWAVRGTVLERARRRVGCLCCARKQASWESSAFPLQRDRHQRRLSVAFTTGRANWPEGMGRVPEQLLPGGARPRRRPDDRDSEAGRRRVIKPGRMSALAPRASAPILGPDWPLARIRSIPEVAARRCGCGRPRARRLDGYRLYPGLTRFGTGVHRQSGYDPPGLC